MTNRKKIDVQIYLDKIVSGINQMGILESISEEWGIEKEDLEETLKENILYQAEINFEESGDPTLTEVEFEDIIHKSTVECTIESMVDQGILVKNLDLESMENTYSINPESDLLEDGDEEER